MFEIVLVCLSATGVYLYYTDTSTYLLVNALVRTILDRIR